MADCNQRNYQSLKIYSSNKRDIQLRNKKNSHIISINEVASPHGEEDAVYWEDAAATAKASITDRIRN